MENSKESFESFNFEAENSIANISVNHDNRTVWVNDVRSSPRGRGYGSKLLDELKIKYPDYTITGQASPLDFERPEKPTDDEMERASDLGWSPASKGDKEFQDPGFKITPSEESFLKDVALRFHEWKSNEPVPRLFNFYKKNGFVMSPSGSGWFESNPPHRLRSEIGTLESKKKESGE